MANDYYDDDFLCDIQNHSFRDSWMPPNGFYLSWMEMLREEKMERNRFKDKFELLDLEDGI